MNFGAQISSTAKLFRNPAFRQSGMLFGSMGLNMLLGIVVSIVNTRYLGPEAYGKFKLLGNLYTLTPTLITFGYFNSVGRLVAQQENHMRRNSLLGSGVVIASIISLLMTGLLFILSFWISEIFRTEVSAPLRYTLPFVFVFPLLNFLRSYCQGDNKIFALSVIQVVPALMYCCGALLIVRYSNLALGTALYLQLICLAVVVVGVLAALRPSFRGSIEGLHDIQSENKLCGVHLYLGSLAAVGSAQMFGLLIGFFVDVKTVGYFSLALAVCAPLAFVGSVFGTVFFKKFSNIAAIPFKIQLSAFGACGLTFIVFVSLVEFLVLNFYGPDYAPVVSLAYLMGFGFMVHGLGDLYNRFLYAHGKGESVRNGAFVTAVVAVTFGFFLTRIYGGTGAAIAKLATSCTYFFMMVVLYVKERSRALKYGSPRNDAIA